MILRRNIGATLKIYVAIALLRFSEFRKDPVKTLKRLFKGYLRTLAFIVLACWFPPTIYCYLSKWQNKTDYKQAILSFVITSLFMVLEPKSRIRDTALFLVPKMVEAVYNMISYRGLLPLLETFKIMGIHIDHIVFAIAIGILSIGGRMGGRTAYMRSATDKLCLFFWKV